MLKLSPTVGLNNHLFFNSLFQLYSLEVTLLY